MFRRWVVIGLVSFNVVGTVVAGYLAASGTPPNTSASPTAPAAGDQPVAHATSSPEAPERDDVPVETPFSDLAHRPTQPRDLSALSSPRGANAAKVHPDLAMSAAKDRSDRPGVDQARSGDDYVAISAVAKRSGSELLGDLQELGLVDGLAHKRIVSGRLPSANVKSANNVETLRYMRPEWSIRSVGAVDSQGDKALRADIGRKKFGVSGKGVTVGVLSDSFDCLDSYREDVAKGELPAGIKVIKEGDCAVGSDEGRAMAQIIADVAPKASLKFRTAMGGPLAMRNGIKDLVGAGADVIVDDIGYLNEPFFQEGIAARAVNAAAAQGVSYFSAAGNSGRASYEAPFDDAGKGLTRETRSHDFDPGPAVDTRQRITIAPMTLGRFALQWADNFKTETPSGPAPKTDLDFVALSGDDLVDISVIPNSLSLEPFEVLFIPNATKSPLKVDLAIERVAGPAPRFVKWLAFPAGGNVRVDQHATSGATIVGHAQASGAMAVGASTFKRTPAYGTSPPVLNSYSSRGSTPILIGKDGLPVEQAFRRPKPDVVAPDGANTSFFGADTADDGDRLPNFFGTSAAAPHAAGVAALLLEKVPKAKADDVCNALSSTAIEMGPKGFDPDSGHGFVDAHAALKWLNKTGRNGPCPAAAIDLDIPLPVPEPPALVAPTETATPIQPEVPAVPAAPVATPTPKPARPNALLFVDEVQVAAGDKINVSGWYFPSRTRVDISLDGERTLGSAQSDGDGQLSTSLKVPSEMSDGRYTVVATGSGRGPVSAARPLTVFQRDVVLRQAPAPIRAEPAGSFWDLRTVLTILALAVFPVLLFVLWRLPTKGSFGR